MSHITLKEAAVVLMKNGFKYKNKTITPRTVKTMAKNGVFKTLENCVCNRSFIVSDKEILELAKQGSLPGSACS